MGITVCQLIFEFLGGSLKMYKPVPCRNKSVQKLELTQC